MVEIPDHMVLLPGVIDSKSNFVEHPEVVAQRLEAIVAAVGDRERVVASVDWQWLDRDLLTLEGRPLNISWADGESLWVSLPAGLNALV